MEFLVLAYDGKDPEAPARRQAAREAHIEGVKAMVEAGTFINGGALLDDQGNMIGSTLYVDFPSLEEVEAWAKNDPYVKGGVWVDIEIKPIRLVFRK